MPDKRKIRFNHSALYDGARWLPAALLVMASIPAPAYSHAPATTPAATPAAATTPAAKASPRPAPAFTLPATDGKTHSLAAYRGIEAWATLTARPRQGEKMIDPQHQRMYAWARRQHKT
ncbi:MAG TPA: hypothetical protein VNA16_10105 [Abditibacteriaceae bacterium]|nr:hypothetical protein [Abditibacteriaceae bacterium]